MKAGDELDAIVVGAGPAGSAAAGMLAGAGRRTLVLEKDRFPRPKVCGEFLSASARRSLERLGAAADVDAIAEPIRSGAIHLPGGREVPFALPAPALGISRFALDDLLARRAAALGARVRFGARILALEPRGGGFLARFSEGGEEHAIFARCAVGAWGRWAPGPVSLDGPRRAGRSGPQYSAWSRDYAPGGFPEGQVRLYVFPGGYCGLSRVEGGAVNLAGVIRERTRRRLDPGWPSVLRHARRHNPALDRDVSNLREGPLGFLGAGPVYFARQPPARRGVLMAGDAAGVIDPFSGEGQASALASGILAGELTEEALAGRLAIEKLPGAYAQAWGRRFGRRFGWSAALRRLMLHPAAGAAAARLVGRSAVRFAIGRLGDS